MVELVLQGVDVAQQQGFILLSPLVVDANVFLEDEGLVEQGDLRGGLRLGHPLPNPSFVLAVADGLHQLRLQLLLTHWVFVLQPQPLEGVFGLVFFARTHGFEGRRKVVVHLNVHSLSTLLHPLFQAPHHQLVFLLPTLHPAQGFLLHPHFPQELVQVFFEGRRLADPLNGLDDLCVAGAVTVAHGDIVWREGQQELVDITILVLFLENGNLRKNFHQSKI